MATFKKGDTAKMVAVVPQGPVEAMRMSEDGIVSYMISWTDVNGTVQMRWFEESALVAA